MLVEKLIEFKGIVSHNPTGTKPDCPLNICLFVADPGEYQYAPTFQVPDKWHHQHIEYLQTAHECFEFKCLKPSLVGTQLPR